MKYIHITVFIFIYIASGFLLKLSGNEYLLLGVPLALFFQLLVRKKSIQSTWVRGDEKFVLNKIAILYGFFFSIYPIFKLYKVFAKQEFNIISLLYNSCAIIGAVACGYSISKMTKKTIKETILCFLITGILGSLMCLATAIATSYKNNTDVHFNFENFITSLLLYTPVVFVLEEVIFRGILDEHVSENDQKINYWSILFVSCLWG